MESLLILCVLAIFGLLALPLVIAIRRATELFYLKIEKSSVRHVRGRLPPQLLEDIREIVRRSPVESAKIRVVSEGGSPRLVATGKLSDSALQQLRNVVGGYRLQQIRAGRRAPR